IPQIERSVCITEANLGACSVPVQRETRVNWIAHWQSATLFTKLSAVRAARCGAGILRVRSRAAMDRMTLQTSGLLNRCKQASIDWRYLFVAILAVTLGLLARPVAAIGSNDLQIKSAKGPVLVRLSLRSEDLLYGDRDRFQQLGSQLLDRIS